MNKDEVLKMHFGLDDGYSLTLEEDMDDIVENLDMLI